MMHDTIGDVAAWLAARGVELRASCRNGRYVTRLVDDHGSIRAIGSGSTLEVALAACVLDYERVEGGRS